MNYPITDFDLGIVGFKYSDLYDAQKLKEIAEKFYDDVKDKNPILYEALTKYIENRGAGYEKKVESKILTDAAPYLSDFIARCSASTASANNCSEFPRTRPDLEIQIFCPAPRHQKIFGRTSWLILTKRN